MKLFTSLAALVGSPNEKANIVGPTNKSSKQENLVSLKAFFARVLRITFKWTSDSLASFLKLVNSETEAPW